MKGQGRGGRSKSHCHHRCQGVAQGPEQVSQVKRLMADSRKDLGTQTYEQHLDELLDAEQITEETRRAAMATVNPGPVTSRRSSKQAS